MSLTEQNQTHSSIDGVLETVLYADDLDRAEAFYSGLLGLKLQAKEEGRHLFYRCGNQMLLVFNPTVTANPAPDAHIPVPPHGAHGPGHICFPASRDTLMAWKEKLKANGVEIETEFEWPQGGHSIYFRDPAGNCLEFAEPRIWGLK
ncbi:Glyoxalase/bleomycin resistance protein/dioxygenase [Candidatus Filomicrobium marinum]|uniref:Glyoxalase/bleomycin resistance protein/dioxygenase n=2 Tax=Filomicrobium TaxID=119044 RepID=A0A0D6JC29_9HYPH|nr:MULTISPECIES: VOC family protein [Filomicrobium]CFX07106.1 Glyoxalase/bleomycin resistance protein/dioxygenase [Candidatus Filomicrobium marinum]CPR16549.1 Glyoxalase/bleomycin resistance protein/dioxygenase [Candidatus Filomicrobium marinum]SDP57668.1 Catechol 2,3-dioxygenase [Filomicrobium insigne]